MHEEASRRLRVCTILHESALLGAGLVVARVMPALRALGCDVTVLLPQEGPIRSELIDCEVSVLEPARPLGVSLHGWREPPGLLPRLRQTRGYLAGLRAALHACAPDVVHVNSLHALIEGVLARRCGFPVVLHAHEISSPGPKRAGAIRVAAAVADQVVAVSNSVAALYAGAVAPDRLTTVYNGVAPRERIVVADGQLRVGSIGTVCRRKGTDVLVEAARIVRAARPEIEFEHLGPSGLPNEREFEARLRALRGARDDVAFLGAGSSAAALERWSIFALPSREEGFPLASLEAMAGGLPVVASDIAALREQIGNGETGVLIPVGDADALARAILGLAEDPARRMTLGDAARSHVRAMFTYERQAAGLNAAYLAALARRAA
ncbi:MAG: glycosyltransferase family 4 protein [Solirubrobacteraceae bacterium]